MTHSINTIFFPSQQTLLVAYVEIYARLHE